MPGTMTMNGITIFGNAAISGVRRAADIESAAMARWITRKSVHQYPKDNTNPSPAIRLNASTPIGFSEVLAVYRQVWVITAGRRAAMAFQPPILSTARIESGAKPRTIRKNCKTSL